jgi:peptide-methionine (R)-S-oxide reductase
MMNTRIITFVIAGLCMAFGIATIVTTAKAEQSYSVQKSDKEWRGTLDKEAYRVLRKQATERPHSSSLLKEKRQGQYSCAACGHDLFSSTHKFESGTGWPSFYQPAVSGAVASETDYKMGHPRTEVHCARCGGHLGHVFKDGPRPTGLRYCINGVALNFTPIP